MAEPAIDGETKTAVVVPIVDGGVMAPSTANDAGSAASPKGEDVPSEGTLNAVARSLGLPVQRPADECLTLDQLQFLRERVFRAKAPIDELSEEFSALLGVAQRIRSKKIFVESADQRLNYVLDCLCDDPPKLVLARDDRLRLQIDVYRRSGWIAWTLATISSGSPVALVITALAASMAIWSLTVLLIGRGFSWAGPVFAQMFFMHSQALAVITSAAFVGGVVSIATRLKDFSKVRDLDPFAMFWTAMLKPLIGVVLAVFILSALYGQIVTFGFLGSDAFNEIKGELASKTLYILWVLGFLAGFSERFAWDFVDRAQGIAATRPAAK